MLADHRTGAEDVKLKLHNALLESELRQVAKATIFEDMYPMGEVPEWRVLVLIIEFQ